jgi:uncharacterized protein (TIGR03437 family)
MLGTRERRFLFILSASVLFCGVVQADTAVVFDSTGGDHAGTDPIFPSGQLGPLYASFSTGAYSGPIATVKLLLQKTNTGGPITVGLYADENTSAGRLIATLGTITDADLPVTYQLFVNLKLTSQPVLNPKTRYWIGLSQPQGSAFWWWMNDASGLGVNGEYFEWSPMPLPIVCPNNNGGAGCGLGGGYNMQVAQTTPTCTTLGSSSSNLAAAGGTGTIAITGAPGCSWSATTSASWIHITSGQGSGNGSVAYSVDLNSGAARTGAIQIGTQTFTVTQAAAPPCTISIQPTSATYSSAGGTGTITVTATAGCSWTATASASWIHIASGGTGSGTGTVAYSVDANAASARTGSIQVGTQALAVNQAATGPPPPAISQGGVAEPWTYTKGAAPGAWISIYGNNLSNTTQTWSPQLGQPLPVTLGGVTVNISGALAPLSYVSPTLINALVPAAVAQGQTLIVVTNQGLAGDPYQVQTAQFLPAVYSNSIAGVSPPRFYVTAVDPVTGQLLGKVAADPRVSRPARPGDTIDLYALGLGPSAPSFPTDIAFSASYQVTSSFSVVVGGVTITPSFAALIGPGLYQARIAIPASMPSGDQPILLDFGVLQSALNVYLSIQP